MWSIEKKNDLLWSVANTRSVVFCCKHTICSGVVVCFCCGLLQTHDLLRSVANANCWGLLQTRFVDVVCCKHTICCGLLQTRFVVVCCKHRICCCLLQGFAAVASHVGTRKLENMEPEHHLKSRIATQSDYLRGLLAICCKNDRHLETRKLEN